MGARRRLAAPDAGMDAPQATDAGMDATQATDAGMDAPQATDAGMDATPATDGAGPPVTARFLFVFYTPHGTVLDAWRPSGGTGNLTLSPILAPLEPYKDRITVIDGLDNVSAPQTPTQTSVDGPTPLLTARATGGPSIDYLFDTPSHYQPRAVADTRTDFGDLVPQRWINRAPTGHELIGTVSPRSFQLQVFVDDSSMLPLASFPADSDYWGKGRAFIDIIASAFERDVIRSATLLWGTVGAALPVEGTGKTLRELADASGTSPAREQFVSLQTSYAAELAATIAKLEAIVLAPTSRCSIAR